MKIYLYPKNKLALIAFLLSCGMFFGVYKNVFSETMSGGGYTLNGSTNTILNQGEGEVYMLNPDGGSVSGQNSSGGVYTLYPTPYIKQAPAVISEVIGLAIFGSVDQKNAIDNTNTPDNAVQDSNFVFDPKNIDRTKIETLPGAPKDSEYSEYSEYSKVGAEYVHKDNPDIVNFSKEASTSENKTGESVARFPFFWFIVLIILFIFRKLKVQK